jgi:hypothetical protein
LPAEVRQQLLMVSAMQIMLSEQFVVRRRPGSETLL